MIEAAAEKQWRLQCTSSRSQDGRWSGLCLPVRSASHSASRSPHRNLPRHFKRSLTLWPSRLRPLSSRWARQPAVQPRRATGKRRCQALLGPDGADSGRGRGANAMCFLVAALVLVIALFTGAIIAPQVRQSPPPQGRSLRAGSGRLEVCLAWALDWRWYRPATLVTL
jgi:hypothetical protein